MIFMKIPNMSGKMPLIFGGILLLVAIAPSYYFYSQYRSAEKKLFDPNTALKEETNSVLNKVKRLIIVPEGETPTIATISDVDKLKDRAFFATAKNGDKLLIFTNAKKAILYDPVKDRIIDVGPVSLPEPTSASLSSTISQQSSPLKLVLLNGTFTTGLALTFENNYKSKLSNIEIVDKNNAKKRDYEKTLIIDLTSKNKDEVEKISKAIGAEISTLPAGETKPVDADVLVIIGKDKTK
jgi:hypothetical protein